MSIKSFGVTFFAALVVLIVAGCGPGTHTIVAESALGKTSSTDYLQVAEPRTNNSFSAWLRYNDTDAFCTFDTVLIAKVYAIYDSGDHKVRIFYRSRNDNDPEANHTGNIGSDGCANEKEGNQVYKLLDVQVMEAHYYPGAPKLPDEFFKFPLANVVPTLIPSPVA